MTSWTALTVSGLCGSYRAFGEKEHLERAIQALDFILVKARKDDGGLHHTFHHQTGHLIAGFMEDYAFTIKACLDMYESTFDTTYLTHARDLLNYSFDKFYDGQTGMFWFTSQDESELFAKKQDNDDSVIPASNSTMAMNMLKLGKYFSRLDWIERSDRMVLAAWGESHNIRRSTNWGKCVLARSTSFYEIVLASNSNDEIEKYRVEFDEYFFPQTIFTCATPGDKFPKWIEGKAPSEKSDNSIRIYVCQEGACQLPVETVEEAIIQLNLK